MKLSKVYEPSQFEEDIYDLWEKSGAFVPKKGNHSNSYIALMPPPNANGDLHIGHALDIALKDTIIRRQRMMGKRALFLPGADHAGFETWVVFEKQLAKEGKSRFDYSREELYDLVWKFVEKNRENLTNQFRRLGASVDWSRFVFTLDDQVVRTVYSSFKKLWDAKLIYRGERLVNFCTFHGTAFADIEVEYEEVKSKIWEIKYNLSDGTGFLTVATTRPETLLGDTAVAVNPNDKRYKDFVGKTVRVPLTNRDVPVIADEMVDKKFGTGAVKITPAHDPNDFEVSERHDLPRISIIDHEGKITHEAPQEFVGLSVLEARQAVLDKLTKKDLLVSSKNYSHSVGHCYKCKTIIEPMIRAQWFIDMKKLSSPAIKKLKKDEINFLPSNKKDLVVRYLENIKDWNISRQIAWGIPIPAFQNIDDENDWIFDERVDKELIKVGTKIYKRDPDVFDTWFSSGQWPFATLGYPDGHDFKQFYPNHLMETGIDLLQQWVSRMIVLGYFVTNKAPFETVYFHGMILDPKGAKMSKSKGNVVNPLTIADKHGVDALRMGLLTGTSAGNNMPYEESKVIGARNFCNKVWNISRYIEGVIDDKFSCENKYKLNTTADHWIANRFNTTLDKVNSNMEKYRVGEAYNSVYHFIWGDLADWYIEASKSNLNKELLAHLLDSSLKLLHPFAPFLTETIWQTVGWHKDTDLIAMDWPKKITTVKKAPVEAFTEVKNLVSEARNIIAEVGVKKPTLYFKKSEFIVENAELISRLAGLSGCKQVEDGRGVHLTNTKIVCWLDIDFEAAQAYVTKLKLQRGVQLKIIESLQSRLANKAYISNAPKNIVNQTKEKLADEQEKLAKTDKELVKFTNFSA